MEGATWIDLIGAVGSIITPVLILVGGVVVWKYRQTVERKMRLEQDLRDDRVDIYNHILEPFIILLMSDEAWKSDPKLKAKDKLKIGSSKMLSLEYKKTSFELRLMGSDDVVQSYDKLMSYFSRQADTFRSQHTATDINTINTMKDLLGGFLLSVRKSLGNESTKLTRREMADWLFAYS